MADTTLQATYMTPTMVAVDELNFDKDNPRFVDSRYQDDTEVVTELYEQNDVDELIQSILSAGYIDFEPLIVLENGKVVLEGNRRLAALRLISDETLRRKLKISLPNITIAKPLPTSIRAILVQSREDARSFIGFKHINGPFKWDALAKAKYAAEWFKSGGKIEEISRTLGDNHNTVRRLVNGWFALEQARQNGFDLSQISRKHFAFSHLYTALTRASVRNYLGMNTDSSSIPPTVNPVPTDKAGEFQQLMSWLYGQEHKAQSTIIQSQNPDLNNLSEVLGNPEAKAMLIAKRDLNLAYMRVKPESARFEEMLMKTTAMSQDVLGLSGAYDGQPTLLKAAEGMLRTNRTLVTAMQERVKKDSGEV